MYRLKSRGCSILALVLLGAALQASCAPSAAEPARQGTVYEYHSSTPGVLQSTLWIADSRQQISAITQLADGSCLTEEARFDAAGRVLQGKASLNAADSSRSREVAFDAVHGSVDVRTPRFHSRWPVPHDLPWAWTSLLDAPASAAPVATPLAAIVAMRAASAEYAVRWLNVAAFESHTIMVDQVLVPDEHSVTVVLGDDWADLTDGIPTRMQLAALQTSLQNDETQSTTTTLSACNCAEQDSTLHGTGG